MQELMTFLEARTVLLVAFIICARIIDVSLGTIRTICVVRGQRRVAAVLGFCEVLTWIVGVSGVLLNITLIKVLAYATCFALGNAVGIAIEQRIGLGTQMIFFMSKNRGHSVAMALRLNDYRVTELPARGRQGRVAMSFVITGRRKVGKAIRLAEEADHEVRAVVADVRTSSLERIFTEAGISGISGYEPTGWRAILKKK